MRYILSFTNSDLLGGDDFHKALVTSGAAYGELDIVLASNQTRQSFGFTPVNRPGPEGAEGVDVIYDISINVIVPNSNIWASTIVSRVDASGAVQNSSGGSGEQQLTIAGTYNFQNTYDLGFASVGERLRVEYFFRNDTVLDDESIRISFGRNPQNRVDVPWDYPTRRLAMID